LGNEGIWDEDSHGSAWSVDQQLTENHAGLDGLAHPYLVCQEVSLDGVTDHPESSVDLVCMESHAG
jgi:hypothetical protein